MIIYSRTLSDATRQTRLGLSRFRKQLNFFRFLEKQRVEMVELLKTPSGRQLLSNVAAAAVTQMVYRHHIPPRSRSREYDPNVPPLVDILSQLFDQKTQSLGFSQTTNAQRWRDSHAGRIFLVVAGCQTDSILERRVRAAARLVSSASLADALIVFSGANPTYTDGAVDENAEARIIDEAAQMCSLFESELGPAAIDRLNLRLHTESGSGKTVENIIRSLKEVGEALPSFPHLVIVSSSFHLPRVSKTALDILKAVPHSFKTLSLVGSELPYNNGSAIRWDIDYLRSSFYEAMRIMVDESDPDILVRQDAH